MRLFKKLNAVGAAHIIVPMIVVVGAGIIGSYLLIQSHADSIRVNCSDSGSKYAASYGSSYEKYNCSFYGTSPVVNANQSTVGTIHSGTNWILCQQQGAVYRKGSYYNNWWAYVKADNGAWGWVNGVFGNGGTNNSVLGNTNGAFGYGIPQCSNNASLWAHIAGGSQPLGATKSCIPIDASGHGRSGYFTQWQQGDGSAFGVCYGPYNAKVSNCISPITTNSVLVVEGDGSLQYEDNCRVPA